MEGTGNHNISHKKIIWRTHYIKTSENTKQGIIIQMHSLQHAQINQPRDNIDGFY